MTIRFFIAVLCGLLLSSVDSLHAEESTLLTLAVAEQTVLSHPTLARQHEQAQALADVPPQVIHLPDPSLSLSFLNLPLSAPSFSREGMTQTQLAISQSLPFPGKRELRADAASSMAKAAAYELAELRLVLLRNVRMRWWNLVYLDHALETVHRNQTLLRQLVRIADSKYKTGQGLQSDVLLAQLELSRLLDSDIALQRARREQAIAMNTLLQRSPDAPVILPDAPVEDLPALAASPVLQQRAWQNRPSLQAERERIAASTTAVALAKKDYYPDFTLTAAYGMRAGRSDLGSVMLNMQLPLFDHGRQDHALEQRESEHAAAQFALQDRQLQVDAEVAQAVNDYEAARQQALLFKTGIIPQAGQTVAAMLAAYQVSKVDFLNLVRTQVTHYNYETEYWKAISLAHQAAASLRAAVAGSIYAAEVDDE